MRARPGLLTAVLFLASGLAAASEAVVPWSQLDLTPARAEAPALGPDRLAAGPTGQVAIWNPASGWLDLYDGLGAFKDGEASASVRLRAVDDLVWTDAGLVVLDAGARQVSLYDPLGQRLDRARLPDLVPPDCGLAVQGAALYATDAFGNRHGLAQLSAAGFGAWNGARVSPPEVVVRALKSELEVDGVPVPVPAALKTSGRVLTGGGQRWLIVDQVVGDAPIHTARTAISLKTGVRTTLSPANRLYAPSADLSVNGRGQLVWLSAQTDGAHLIEVNP